MNAILAVVDEEVRLYSRQPAGPIDVIAPQHAQLHVELEAFGRWCREKYQPGTCDSVERRFDPGEGGRKARAPTIDLPENPMHRRLDGVVRYMRMHLPQHGEAIRMYYVGVLPHERKGKQQRPALRAQYIRCSPMSICRTLRIHWSTFGTLMFDSRAAVLNLLRRQG